LARGREGSEVGRERRREEARTVVADIFLEMASFFS
jgi:hypothetical protein